MLLINDFIRSFEKYRARGDIFKNILLNGETKICITFTLNDILDINPLMPGGNKKVTHA